MTQKEQTCMEKVKKFINNEMLFSRGIYYYHHGLVTGFRKNGGLIEASVKGSSRKPYLVQIKCDNFSEPIAAFCTCPYFRTHGRCKHIAAVLIYNLRESGPIENPLKRSPETSEDVVIDLKGGPMKSIQGFDFISRLTRATGLPKGAGSTKRYRLVFILHNLSSYFINGWVIHPAIQYVRRAGKSLR